MARVPRSSGSLFIYLLGGFRVTGPRAADPLLLERKKTRALLAMLAVDPAKALPRGKLTALLWSEQNEDTARHGLRQCLLDLRQALARVHAEVLRTEGDLIGLDAARVVVDVTRFEQCLGRGTLEALEEAVALYQGDLLEGFSVDEHEFEGWLQLERERLRSRAVEALRKLLAHHVRSKVTDTAVQVALRLLTLESFDETVHRTLMRLYADSGRRTAALRQYEACVEVLARELGAEPEAETRELYRRLVSQRDQAGTMPATARTPRKPTPRAARGPVLDASTRSTPFIGREAERDWLDGLREAAYGGRPQLGLVLGEAGIGKSRLVGELTSIAQERRPLILLSRGREGEDILPFAPWMEALRPALSVDVLGRLAPVTRQDLARLLPETADGPGVPPSGSEDGPRIFEAVAHLLRELAVRRRLIIVIEDLHWCDDMTVRLLRFLPRRLEGRSVLLLGTARQEEIPAGRGVALDALRQDPCCAARTLGPLSRDEATQLFQAFLAPRDSAPSPEVAERMWRLSEGNPFVIIECARAVRDRRAALDHASLGLPDQVRALTARGLAHLSDLAARLTDVASVIGRDFDVAVLRQAAGLTDLEMADGVEELVRRRVLREVDGRFDFRHDRVREVAYARLLGPRRTLLHRQVAGALEAVYADALDAHSAAVGVHYRRAGIWPKACEYQARAGFQASARGATREAVACFDDALDALARLPDTEERRELGLRMRLAVDSALVTSAYFERGRKLLHEAEHIARTLPDGRWAGRVAAALSFSYLLGGAFDRALTFGQQALDIARRTDDRRLESAARLVLGPREYAVGNFRGAIDHVAAALGTDTRGLDLMYLTAPQARVRFWTAGSHVHLGEFDAAMRVIDESLRASDTPLDPLRLSRLLAQLALGGWHTARGDAEAAVQAWEAALAIYREDSHRSWFTALAAGLGAAYVMCGRASEGVEWLERAEAVTRTSGHQYSRPQRLAALARALVEGGRVEDGARIARDALALARQQGARPWEAAAHAVLAEVASRQNPVASEEMERHLGAAVTLAETLQMQPLAARCHLALAKLYARTARPERDAHRAAARSLLARMGGHLVLSPAEQEAAAFEDEEIVPQLEHRK